MQMGKMRKNIMRKNILRKKYFTENGKKYCKITKNQFKINFETKKIYLKTKFYKTIKKSLNLNLPSQVVNHEDQLPLARK